MGRHRTSVGRGALLAAAAVGGLVCSVVGAQGEGEGVGDDQDRAEADALRTAQLELLNGAGDGAATGFSSPVHWAGFQLVGDWR